MYKVESKLKVPIKTIEIIPKNWWSRILLKVANWEYRMEW